MARNVSSIRAACAFRQPAAHRRHRRALGAELRDPRPLQHRRDRRARHVDSHMLAPQRARAQHLVHRGAAHLVSASASAPSRTKSPRGRPRHRPCAWTRSTKCSDGSKAASEDAGGRSLRRASIHASVIRDSATWGTSESARECFVNDIGEFGELLGSNSILPFCVSDIGEFCVNDRCSSSCSISMRTRP